MADHLSVTTKDLRRLLELTDPAKIDEPGNPLPWSLLTGLMNLVGCDGVTYESHDVANRAVLHHQSTSRVGHRDDVAAGSVQKSSWNLYGRGLCDYWPRTGWSSWGGTAYVESIRRLGVHGELTIAFPPDGGLHHRLLLWRFTGRDFTERDRLLLTLIQPRLVSLHAAIRSRQTCTVDLTPRQWELMRLMAAGQTNRQIASRLALSEGTVRTHCEHIFHRLQVTNRVAAVARAFPTDAAWVLTTPTPANAAPGP